MSYDGMVTAWDPFRWSHSVKYDDNEVEVQHPPLSHFQPLAVCQHRALMRGCASLSSAGVHVHRSGQCHGQKVHVDCREVATGTKYCMCCPRTHLCPPQQGTSGNSASYWGSTARADLLEKGTIE